MNPANNKAKTKPLLPSLKEGHNVSNFDDAGKWYDRMPNELGKISKGLDVNAAHIQINSIPDIWARALLFEMALFDKDHKLNEIVTGEWRGLLALIALKEVKHYSSFEITSIEFDKKINKHDKVWHEALRKLLPDNHIFDDTSWLNSFIFLTNKRAIGMTSPNTIVFTASNYFDLSFSEKWYDGEFLVDPLPYLSSQERNMLSSWLKNLIKNVRKHSLRDASDDSPKIKFDKLTERLNDFIKDLSAEEIEFEAGTSLGIKGDSIGIFAHLDKPIGITGDTNFSNVRLIPSKDYQPEKPILLVDRDIASSWHVQPHDVTIQKNVTLASIPIEGVPANQHDKIGNFDIESAEIWRPQDLFTDNLYYIDLDNAFPGAIQETWIGNKPKINKRPISVILPIAKKILDHLEAEDLISKLNLSQDSNGNITIRLTLKLSGFTDDGKDYEIVRKYDRKVIFEYSQVPILQLFPNIISDGWNYYSIAYSADNKNATFQVKPFPPHKEEINLTIPKNSNGIRTVWRLDSFPKALECYAEGEEIGVLLLNVPEKETSASRTCTVGVDFGASGTSVYMFDNVAEQITFKDRKLSITSITESQRADVAKFFLPEVAVTMPFLTLFHDFNNTSSNQQQPLPFLNGHVYYYAKKNQAGGKASSGNKDTQSELSDNYIYADMKWSEDPAVRRAVKSFLNQICLQTSVELATNGISGIKWKYSYPTAFGSEQLGEFDSIWKQIVESNFEHTGIETKSLEKLTESVAAAQYFLEAQNASTATGAIFVDIGSSTSDISVWQGKELVWQVSLRYAGRNIFLNYLKNNLDVLKHFDLLNDEIKGTAENTNNTIFYAEMDSILQSESDNIFNQLPIKAALPEIKDLKQHLALGLSALFFYVGLGISSLEDKYNPKTPHIYIGGNGSQMFKWLTNGPQITQDHPFAKLFEAVFLSAVETDLTGVFDLSMSNQPKKEAAYGLVCDESLKKYDNNKNLVFAGENFVQDQNVVNWKKALSKEDGFLESTIQPPEKLENLDKFIETFNEFARREDFIKEVNYNEKIRDLVYRRVDNSLQSKKFIEPIFILAVKHLLEISSEQ